MPEEKFIAESQEPEPMEPVLEHETPELEKKISRLRKIEEKMKVFVATGAVILSFGGVLEVGAKMSGFKPEGERVKLENVDDIQYRDGVIKAEEIKAFLGAMPANWGHGEVVAVEGLDKSSMDRDSANVVMEYQRLKLKVGFDKGDMKKLSRFEVLESLGHEFGHANDFLSDNDLSEAEKESLKDKISKLFSAPDRFRSFTIEIAVHENAGERRVLAEYWAELCSSYMLDPTVINAEEFRLVDDYAKKNDPNYNWKESIEKRWAIAYGK